jgi:Domain of unknown function (DUF4411)
MYLLDMNVLTEAKNRYYAFPICPGFWNWLRQESARGTVGSVDKIRDEIEAGDRDDPLRQWIRHDSPLNFHSPDSHTIQALKEISNWVADQNCPEREKQFFLSKADPLLIAYAKAHNHTVVTHEVLVGPTSKKVKIPNVCEAMQVQWLDCFKMLHKEKASFHLNSQVC